MLQQKTEKIFKSKQRRHSMDIREPASMDECVFFTRRTIGEKGKIAAWVLRDKCPQCKQGVMGKPRDEKTGKVKIRAKEYVCPQCSFSMEEEAYENTLQINIKYTCPHCGGQGTTQQPFLFKKMKTDDPESPGSKKTAKVIRFSCSACKKDIDLVRLK